MSSCTYAQARDDVLAMVKTAWALAPETYVMIWDDLKGVIPTTMKPWARTTLKHNDGRQATLCGDSGQKHFERNGILTIQLFTPSGDGLYAADSLIALFTAAFEGKQSSRGIWFKNVRINEIGEDGAFFQTNIIIEFEYYEVK